MNKSGVEATGSGNVEKLREMLAAGQSVKPTGRRSAAAAAQGLVMWAGGIVAAAVGGLAVGALISRLVYEDPVPVFAASVASDTWGAVRDFAGGVPAAAVPEEAFAWDVYGPAVAYGPEPDLSYGLDLDVAEEAVAVPPAVAEAAAVREVPETKYVPDVVPDPVPEPDGSPEPEPGYDEPPEPVLPENELTL